MKTIKAFVRTSVAKHVIKKLEEKNAKNIMVEKIDEMAEWDDNDAKLYSLEYLEKFNTAGEN